MDEWEEIKQLVEQNGNLYTVSMEVLRNALGVNRLGIHVCNDISRRLSGMGLGHVPKKLPMYHHEQVRIYKRGTPVGELIEWVLEPGEANDRKLLEQSAEESTDYATIVEQIRELVQE